MVRSNHHSAPPSSKHPLVVGYGGTSTSMTRSTSAGSRGVPSSLAASRTWLSWREIAPPSYGKATPPSYQSSAAHLLPIVVQGETILFLHVMTEYDCSTLGTTHKWRQNISRRHEPLSTTTSQHLPRGIFLNRTYVYYYVLYYFLELIWKEMPSLIVLDKWPDHLLKLR